MFSKLKRIGTKSCRVDISLDLKVLTLIEVKDDIAELYIDFERGSKCISSGHKDNKKVVTFNENVHLEVRYHYYYC